MSVQHCNIGDANKLISDLRPFQSGDIRGTASVAPAATGRLPRQWAEQFRTDYPDIVYVVVSYTTPVGWVVRRGVTDTAIIPDAWYSGTTTRHQGVTLRAFQGSGISVLRRMNMLAA